jgi:hypothetical protein
MAEFRIVIEGIDLGGKRESLIEAGLQKVLLEHLADIDLTDHGRDEGSVAVVLKPGKIRGGKALILSQNELEKIPQFREM